MQFIHHFTGKKALVFFWIIIFSAENPLAKPHRKNLTNLDSSCKNVAPPEISDAMFVRLKHEEHSNTQYFVAEYKCNHDHTFQSNLKLYCSKHKWIGEKPKCKKPEVEILNKSTDKCREINKNCQHFCSVKNGEATCKCFKGFQLVRNGKCIDINECLSPKTKQSCPHGCVNLIGSYYCTNGTEGFQSDEPRENNETVYEQYEDEDYEDTEEYDDEDEDYDRKKKTEATQTPALTIEATTPESSSAASTSVASQETDNKLEEKEDSEVEEYEEYEEEYDDEDNPAATTAESVTESLTTKKPEPASTTEICVSSTDCTENADVQDNVPKELDAKEDGDVNVGKESKENEKTDEENEEYEEDYDDYEEEYDENKKAVAKEVDVTTEFSRTDEDLVIEETPNVERVFPEESLTSTTTTQSPTLSTVASEVKEDLNREITTRRAYKENPTRKPISMAVDEDLDKSGENTEVSSTTLKSADLTTLNPDLEIEEYEEEYEEEEEEEEKQENVIPDNDGSRLKVCGSGFVSKANECADINECETGQNTCSHSCENTVGGYDCQCPDGLKLSPRNKTHCEDIDECFSNPCSHVCLNTLGSYECQCPEGLILQNGTSCANLSCSHTSTKIDGVFQCTCPLGFALGTDQRTCEDVDECLIENTCSHQCENVIGSFRCVCPSGFRLEKDAQHCVDIDECVESNICPETCENTPGTFKCLCQEGFQYDPVKNKCRDIDECDEKLNLSDCEQLCINYEGSYECSCKAGYFLSDDDITCVDIDECSIYNGNCSQLCENLPGSFTCKCKENYRPSSDNKTCLVNDPCLENNGGCSHQCVVQEDGAAACSCPEGQILEGKKCTKVDPCSVDNGGCSHVCVNVDETADCRCPEGYSLENTTHCYEINQCLNNNGNCSHFCEFIDHEVHCSCPEMHTLVNNSQCIEHNPCEVKNGGCSHLCTFEDHKIVCSCPETHNVHNDTYCVERNPCLLENGGCSHQCIFENGNMFCNCPEKYKLEGKTCYRIDPCFFGNGGCSHKCSSDDIGEVLCSCPENYSLNDTKNCVLENLCSKNNGGCSHLCDFSGQTVVCSCPEGYDIVGETSCKKKNVCDFENGGCSDYCEDVQGSPKCSCPEAYELNSDNKTCISDDRCSNKNGGCSHYCKTESGVVQCYCPDHHDLVNGNKCVSVNPCLINNGGCSHQCEFEKGHLACLCPEGYKLKGKECSLINPCLEKNGGCSHACTAINGLAICRCPPDYELIERTCFKLNPCTIDNGGCSHGCHNDHGEVQCLCPPGYKLFGKRCLDEGPCEKHNGGCSHICSDIEGRAVCSCPTGYTLRPNKQVCKEINECRLNRGGCSHGCTNTPGSFECTCPSGFKLKSNNRICEDIDECAINNGGCEVYCKNYKGSFRCDCPEGYTLQRDRKSCRRGEVHQCLVPKSPMNGEVRCPGHRIDYRLTLPSGTSCNVWCNEGFKLRGRPHRTCKDDGEWDNLEAECIAATCPKLPSFERGRFLPGICNTGKIYPGGSCDIHCRPGYRKSQQFPTVRCLNDLSWSVNVTPDILQHFCIRDAVQELKEIYIRCPNRGQLNFVLPPGQRSMPVYFPQPDTNVDFHRYVISQPSWGKRLHTILPVGTTEVTFTVLHSNTTTSCKLTINVEDKESPQVTGCPENIEKVLDLGQFSQIIFWEEPQFIDNVEVARVVKSRAPGTEFAVGLHHINYMAMDKSGNRATCQFTVDVKRNAELGNLNTLQAFDHTSKNRKISEGGIYYKAVLVCPSGAQYENLAIREPEPGCIWKNIKVKQPQHYEPLSIIPHQATRRPYYFRNMAPIPRIFHSIPNVPTLPTLPTLFSTYSNKNHNINSKLLYGGRHHQNYLRNRNRKEYFRWNKR